MKIFMTGGTGFVGTTLTRRFTEAGHKLTLLTRSIKGDRRLPNGATFLEGDPTKAGPWQEKVADHEVIINLAGASIFRRWSEKAKKAIRDSRVLTTQNLVNALYNRKAQVTTLISTSAVGYYGFHGDEILEEVSPAGSDFLASVTRQWEAAAFEAEKFGVRVVFCRFGIVLGSKGGALGQMLPIFRKGLGSPIGSGNQWISWIHEQDLAAVYPFLLERTDMRGAVNCTAPNPVRNREFTRALGKALNRPVFLPRVPGFLIRLKMGEFGSTLLKGQRVVPTKLMDAGFSFQFSNINDALENLLRR